MKSQKLFKEGGERKREIRWGTVDATALTKETKAWAVGPDGGSRMHGFTSASSAMTIECVEVFMRARLQGAMKRK